MVTCKNLTHTSSDLHLTTLLHFAQNAKKIAQSLIIIRIALGETGQSDIGLIAKNAAVLGLGSKNQDQYIVRLFQAVFNLAKFAKIKSQFFNDGIKKYRTSCKSCVLERLKINQKTIYKTKSEKRSSTPKNFISGILNHSAKRKQHLGFNLDLVYLLDIYEKQSGNCAISGVRMTYLAGSGRINTNISIDRIDSSKGYLRDNVQFVCDVVNRMKQDMSQGDLENWCSLILRKAND